MPTIKRNRRARVVAGATGTDGKCPCAFCGFRMEPAHVTIDHVFPLARGGTSDPTNLAACCGRCNAKKNAKDGPEFLAWLASNEGMSWLRGRPTEAEHRRKKARSHRRSIAHGWLPPERW